MVNHQLQDAQRTKLGDEVCAEIVESILGLLLNLTTEQSECVRKHGTTICDSCLAMLHDSSCTEGVKQRSIGLLSHVLPYCVPAVDNVVKKGGTEIFLQHVMVR
jgi:hypothetical protein